MNIRPMLVHKGYSKKIIGLCSVIIFFSSPIKTLANSSPEQPYTPAGGVIYSVPSSDECLKGRGNCALYPKSVQLPTGRLLMAFERSTVSSSGSADGQTIPIYSSDDKGTTWHHLTEVKAPAYLSNNPSVKKYVSNWTNPYLYLVQQNVKGFKTGTLLLATVVSGDDYFYLENKEKDPSWIPNNDGDRANVSLALYSSINGGANWKFESIIAHGGWQGGSAGSKNVSSKNAHAQSDPLWEPYIIVHDGKVVIFYSDENDYLRYDSESGNPVLDPENDTAADSRGQVLVHRVWEGDYWSNPVIDVPGTTVDRGNGKTEIGGGRPGMTTIVPTKDGKWLMTFEYWGGGENCRYKITDNPLKLFASDGNSGIGISDLAVSSGSKKLSLGGSPVISRLPDGRILYNASGSGDIWVNSTGDSDGLWTQFHSPLGSGYSRTLQYVVSSGRIVILQAGWRDSDSTSSINYGEVDLGNSSGNYYRISNRKYGQFLGSGNNVTDADIGNNNIPDIHLQSLDENALKETQYWHIISDNKKNITLINKSGGRQAAIWKDNPIIGQRIASWVDKDNEGLYTLVKTGDGYFRLRSRQNIELYLTASSENGYVTLGNYRSDGSQEWRTTK